MSATMVGHLENFIHLEKNIFDHNFVTNCDFFQLYLLFKCYLISLFLIMSENKCVCYFKNGVWPWAMELFNEKITNQIHSFSDCILAISNVCIRFIISVYECNSGSSKHIYSFSRWYILVKVMSKSNKYSTMCRLRCIIGMPNMKVINIMFIEILQKRSNFDISLLGANGQNLCWLLINGHLNGGQNIYWLLTKCAKEWLLTIRAKTITDIWQSVCLYLYNQTIHSCLCNQIS